MRLWHQDLINKLPRQQLLGQHRECCALRGAGWGRNHSVVNYVFTHIPERLVAYHYLIMDEMKNRGYNPDKIWNDPNYRGKTIGVQNNWCDMDIVNSWYDTATIGRNKIYLEHDDTYYKECIDNLKNKGIDI